MNHLFPNVDFEYELLYGSRPTARVVRDQVRRWAHIMRLVAGWEQAVPDDVARPGSWLPWGVTPSFLALVSGDFPPAEVVKRVNGKGFSHQIERELGVALPGASVVESVHEARESVRHGEWLVKNPWGVAGRERVEVRDGNIDEGWVERHLRLAGALVVEPRVRDVVDWSIQFELGADGVRYLGSSSLVTDALGNHRGHRVGVEAPKAIVDVALDAASIVAAAGYFGPLGIDAFEGEYAGAGVVRPICEINARMTFGRIALELAKYVSAESFYWWHPSVQRARMLPPTQGDVRDAVGPGHYDLPSFSDPEGLTSSRVVLGTTMPGIEGES